VILIDQGGGSTELTLFENDRIIHSFSFSIGTTMLENLFFENSNNSVKEAFKVVKNAISRIIRDELDTSKLEGLPLISTIGIGTAITRATGKQNSSQQHNTRISLNQLRSRLIEFEEKLTLRYSNIVKMQYDIDNIKNKNNDYRKILTSLLGLPYFIEVMEIIGVQEIVVSGTALWYGVYFQKLYGFE
jgi:exopolyphosphatase/pppGpp-phosphohydrolase